MTQALDKTEPFEIYTGLTCRNCGSETDVNNFYAETYYDGNKLCEFNENICRLCADKLGDEVDEFNAVKMLALGIRF